MATTYNSFSGVDITAVFGDQVFGELQMVSYKSDREKGPVYVMGSPDPVAFARGKRLVSGACVFVVFDQDTLVKAFSQTPKDNVYLGKLETSNFGTEGAVTSVTRSQQRSGSTRLTDADATTLGAKKNEASVKTATAPLLHDQILPFDITLVAANEYGSVSKMIIHGVELMTAAGGMSIDDLVIEKQVSFLAKRITDWRVVERK